MLAVGVRGNVPCRRVVVSLKTCPSLLVIQVACQHCCLCSPVRSARVTTALAGPVAFAQGNAPYLWVRAPVYWDRQVPAVCVQAYCYYSSHWLVLLLEAQKGDFYRNLNVAVVVYCIAARVTCSHGIGHVLEQRLQILSQLP